MSAVVETDEDTPGLPLGDPFLRTRIVPPTLPATFLRRPRLVERLGPAPGTPLTLVNGPAGAGKTLLAADWAAGLGRPVAWLTAEAGDERPAVFWTYVLQALRGSGTPLRPALAVRPDAPGVDPRLLEALAAELCELAEPAVLVIDEFDRVTSPEVAEQLALVLRHAGPGLRLVIGTRTEPLMPLHGYRLAGRLTEIRAAELAFTREEAGALLDLHGLSLSADAVGALVDRTRGWAAGLRLCALAARESPDPEAYLKDFEADRSTVADFLLAEVLKGRSEEAQDLLLRVSVLTRFDPGLANALTGRIDAEPLLCALVRENAFVEALGHSSYRLHPLFREILRAHLRERLPALEPELHRRAARWLRRSGSLYETLAHSTAAGEWGFAADALVEDLAMGQLFTGLRSDDLVRLCSAMPPEATGTAPELVRAALDLSRYDLPRGLAHLRRAGEQLADSPASEAPEAQLGRALLEALAARLTGCPVRAERAAEAAERLRQEVPARLLEGHPEHGALLGTHLGSALLWAGRFEDARATLTSVAESSRSDSVALPLEESREHLALIDHLNGWPGRAERRVLAGAAGTEAEPPPEPGPGRADASAGPAPVPGLGLGPGLALGRIVLAAVAVDRDELDRARALLDETAQLDAATHDPVTSAGRALALGRLLLVEGHPRAAAAAAHPAVAAAVDSPWASGHEALVVSAAHLAEGRPEQAAELLGDVTPDHPAVAVEAARILLDAGRAEAAAELVDGIRAGGRAGPAVTVRAALVRAHVAEEAGDGDTARKLVAQALLDARRERLRRPFLDARPWIRHLLAVPPLRELAAGWLTPGPAAAAAPGAAAADPAPPLAVVGLSERERDVLRRLALMMSTEEIAADLYLSVNTVKTHLKGAYRKLAVNRRNDAVRRARELGLL
ncbi:MULTISPECIES: LuxR C-terminal-related transcriptional regulator [unclassified Streptomyces]|uniref:LuxR C-terminal-related transcriptional regulator n=1 Tax=unclassified Streptomyces TaxID=2593676 RepID=UPI001F5BAD65|nr:MULTISPECIES: LuxR C-terminal-related transcriptional regulator [unclassified Streptomyces]